MWNPVSSSFPVVQAIETHIRTQTTAYPRVMPDLTEGGMLIAASDYAGSHRDGRYDVIGCVVTSRAAWERWEGLRRRVRQTYRLGVRRISYTKLNDRHKLRALSPFLQAISTVEGVICCVAINKALPSFFDAAGTQYVTDPKLDDWRHWKPAVFERMLRATALVSLLVAGLAGQGQEVGWVTDEDEIASNATQLNKLATAFGSMAGLYSQGRIPTVRCMTTAGDTGELETEDLAAIPDLAAGAMADVFSAFEMRGERIVSGKTLSLPDSVPPKAQRIAEWLRVKDQPLRRHLFVAEKGQNFGDVTITQVNLW